MSDSFFVSLLFIAEIDPYSVLNFLFIPLNQIGLFYVLYISLVPVPSMIVNVQSNQRVGQSLTLECNVTTVRGITSRVDIVWSSNDIELKRIQEVNMIFTNNNTVLFEDVYSIQLLSTIDDDRVFQCEVVMMTTPLTISDENITLDVTGEFSQG